MRPSPTFEEKQKLVDAVLISLKYGVPLSLEQFRLFMEWLDSIPLNLAQTNVDELNAARVQFVQLLEKFKPQN